MMTSQALNNLGSIILDACITVHRELGPGLLESAYSKALCRELELRGIAFSREHSIELMYKGISLGKTYFIDILVENEIIVEIKSVDEIHPIHEAQLIPYLKIANKRLGYVINFNVALMKDGFKRKVNNL